MKKLTEGWFEFKGVRCTEKNIILKQMPERPKAAQRGESILVPGKNGDVWIPDGAYEIITIDVNCFTSGDDFNFIDINQWLNGSGWLRFSDESNIVYEARATDGFMRGNRWINFSDQEFSVTFTCQPFKYRYLSTDDADDITISATDTTITSQSDIFSEPKITILGTGDCTVSINEIEISIEGLTDGIIIDSELKDCLSLDGSQLLNNIVSMDEFPILKPGLNNIVFTGDVQSITIRPRWRYL